MAAEVKKEIELEIAHVLFIDIVGYSKLSINEQRAAIDELTQAVRTSEQFQNAEAGARLIKIPTGDGMALVFYKSPEEPVECALEISRALKEHRQLRMGVHSGPVSGVIDVNGQANLAGAGLNMAQRVMDCGDAGHILLSKRVADDLGEYEHWRPLLHDLGECEVKHGMRVSIVNLHADEVGNPQLPKKLQSLKKRRARMRWAAMTAALLALVAIVAATAIFSRNRARLTLSALEKSIAVLPLDNLSEEKENAYFADGIQEELLSSLAKIKDLKVISRTSVMQYKAGITRNLKEIAQQLGVSNVIEGSVRRSGNHIRVSVQLIDALTDRHIWVKDYDRTMADSLALQGELATKIAAEVGATLSPQEKARLEATPTKNTAAYEAYLRGRAFGSGVTPDRLRAEGAVQSYQEAVKLDPDFALAWAYLSCAQSSFYWSAFDPSPARLATGKDAADHAVALAPDLSETHLALGYYRYYGKRDFTGALAEFQQAEQGLPNNVDIVYAIGLIQRRLGHWDEATAAMRRAVELDPRNIDAYTTLAGNYMALRRFPDALGVANNLLAFDPTNTNALGFKAYALCAMGNLDALDSVITNPGANAAIRGEVALKRRRYTEAVEILTKGLSEKPLENNWELLLMLGLAQQHAGNVAAARAAYQELARKCQRELEKTAPDSLPSTDLVVGLGHAYAGLGDAASAIREGQKAMTMDPSSDPFEGPTQEESMAEIYAMLGDADHAIPILQRLIKIPSYTAITPTLLQISTIWDPIRNDPRFQELCQEKQQ